MTHVTSLEVSKELHELSGWNDTDYARNVYTGRIVKRYPKHGTEHTPAYSLGYLLRKLEHRNPFIYMVDDKWQCRDAPGDAGWFASRADTPEDAAALLAIKLFEKGILKHE